MIRGNLTTKQIEDLLTIGFGINTDKKVIEIELSVIQSIIAKTYQIAFKKGQEWDTQ